MTIDDVQTIKAILLMMREEDPELRFFGSDYHRYQCGSALSEDVVRAFEQKHQITLPADYRFF